MPSTGTLNAKVRIDEMRRIWTENKKIMGAISTIKSHYPSKEFKKESKYYNIIKKNIAFNSSKWNFCHYFE